MDSDGLPALADRDAGIEYLNPQPLALLAFDFHDWNREREAAFVRRTCQRSFWSFSVDALNGWKDGKARREQNGSNSVVAMGSDTPRRRQPHRNGYPRSVGGRVALVDESSLFVNVRICDCSPEVCPTI